MIQKIVFLEETGAGSAFGVRCFASFAFGVICLRRQVLRAICLRRQVLRAICLWRQVLRVICLWRHLPSASGASRHLPAASKLFDDTDCFIFFVPGQAEIISSRNHAGHGNSIFAIVNLFLSDEPAFDSVYFQC